MGYPHWLLASFTVYWLLWALRPQRRQVWLMENSFTVVLVTVLVWTYSLHRLSDRSYTLIWAFLVIHTIGGHYTYAKVPYDRWFAKLSGGRGLSAMLGLRRNHFDRLVHFCFGLLFAYPVHEILRDLAGIRASWSYVLAISVIISASALFELIEWAAAVWLGGGAGQDYLAAQGDEWDAHKDMALASVGAAIAMGLTVVR